MRYLDYVTGGRDLANEQHRAKLREGVEVWNQWRRDNPELKPDLYQANLSGANLSGADLSQAHLWNIIFAATDLTTTKGLASCASHGPSVIDYQTLQSSKSLPLVFLRGCGLPDHYIDYIPSLVNQPIQYYSCFISYSSKDEEFTKRLYADLQLSHPLVLKPEIHSTPNSSLNTRCSLSISLYRSTSGRNLSAGIFGISS